MNTTCKRILYLPDSHLNITQRATKDKGSNQRIKQQQTIKQTIKPTIQAQQHARDQINTQTNKQSKEKRGNKQKRKHRKETDATNNRGTEIDERKNGKYRKTEMKKDRTVKETTKNTQTIKTQKTSEAREREREREREQIERERDR